MSTADAEEVAKTDKGVTHESSGPMKVRTPYLSYDFSNDLETSKIFSRPSRSLDLD